MKVIGYEINQEGIFSSGGEHCSKPPYLDFLLREQPETIRVFANLDACVANLASLINLSEKEARYLLTSKKKMSHLFDCDISLQYYPEKHFLAGKGSYPNLQAYSQFSDASQYCPDLKKFGNGLTNFSRAKLAQEAGQEAYNIYIKLGFEPGSLTSPVSIFKKQIFRELDLPLICDIPMEAGWMAYQCCKGGWAEVFTRGHFQKVFDYDTNGAYSSIAATLPDLRQGKWLQSAEYQNYAELGYCQCEVKISTDFSPIIWQAERSNRVKNYTPKGKFPAFLTKAEIDFICKWNIGEVRIINGWWWFSSLAVTVKRPLEELVNHYYLLKQQATGLEKRIIKIMIEGGFFGLFLQTFGGEPAKNFLPPYTAEMFTDTRLNVAEACYRNKIKPLAVTVDGFVSEQSMPTPRATELGEWRLAHTGKALIVSSLIVAIEGKTNEGEWSLDYNWLVSQIKQNPEATAYSMDKKAAVSLPLAFQRSKLSEAGKIVSEDRNIYIMENKREYSAQPENGGDLLTHTYESKPYNAELLVTLGHLAQDERYQEIIKGGS